MSFYNPTFSRSSIGKFDPNLGFLSIKGGSDAFLLEDEINEMQWIQNEARSNLIKEMTNSGCLYINGASNTPIKGGKFFPGTADLNSFLLYGFPTIINGYLLNINNILNSQFIHNNIQLPSPPLVDIRYDFVYLEVWLSELKENQTIHELGGLNNNLATFEFIDQRVNALTSRRVQIQWALRVFDPTLDPSGFGIDKNVYDKGFINSTTNEVNPYVRAITDHSAPMPNYTFSVSPNDPNLFITGTGSDNDKLTLRTIDGYVYAIPLFFIDRLNSAPYSFVNPNGGAQYLYHQTSDRPDGKFSDVIYDDQLTDLRPQAYLSTEQYSKLFITNVEFDNFVDTIENDYGHRISTLEGDVSLLDDLVRNDIIITGFESTLGFNADGTKPNYISNNYLINTESIMKSLATLDTNIKAIDDRDSDLRGIVETGFESNGFNIDGTKPDYVSLNYLVSTENIIQSLETLDANIKIIDDRESDLHDVVAMGFESTLGFNTDGTKPNYTSNNYLFNTENIMQSLSTLDAAIKAVDDKDLDLLDVVTFASPNKILRLNANAKLPASITGNADGNAATATKLATAIDLSISSDATGTVSFDGSVDADIAITLVNTGVTPNVYKSVTVDSKGRVTNGTNPTTLEGYGITDAVHSYEFDAMLLSLNNLINTISGINTQTNSNTDAINSMIVFLKTLGYSPLSIFDTYNVDMWFSSPSSAGGIVNPDGTINSLGNTVNIPFGNHANYSVAYLPFYNILMVGKLGEVWVEKSDGLYLLKNSGYPNVSMDAITFQNDGSTVKNGISSFNGSTGIKITMPIVSTDFIFISQLECGLANTGETYVQKELDGSGFTVYNTGATSSQFEWIVIDTAVLTNSSLENVVLNGMGGVSLVDPTYGDTYRVLVSPPDRPIFDGGIGEILIDKGHNTFTLYSTGSENANVQCLIFKQPA